MVLLKDGVNEAGLFFDANALKINDYKLSIGKKKIDGDIGIYILQYCKYVPEALKYCKPITWKK